MKTTKYPWVYRLYTRKDLMAFAGLSLSDANSWPKKGIISVDRDSIGTGHERIYTFLNVIEAAIAKDLSSVFSLETIIRIVFVFRQGFNVEKIVKHNTEDGIDFKTRIYTAGCHIDIEFESIIETLWEKLSETDETKGRHHVPTRRQRTCPV